MQDSMSDARQYAPATERNKQVILQILQQVLPDSGTVLEISSGTGEHAIFFAPHVAPLYWVPSDPNPIARASIDAWRHSYSCESLCGAIALDVRDTQWPVEQPQDSDAFPEALKQVNLTVSPIRAIVNINMIHISPWNACCGLMAGAGRILPSGGILYVYGPFKQGGIHTSSSNASFDQSLRSQNPEWGVRDLEVVIAEAAKHHLLHYSTIPMPANNLSVVFQKE
ncbi:MAG: DUF938 domain-containing protein [Cyanobacteria bacterium P01_A01_bin.37]